MTSRDPTEGVKPFKCKLKNFKPVFWVEQNLCVLFIYLLCMDKKNISFPFPLHTCVHIQGIFLKKHQVWVSPEHIGKYLGTSLFQLLLSCSSFQIIFIIFSLWYCFFHLQDWFQNTPVFYGNYITVMRLPNVHLPNYFPYNN